MYANIQMVQAIKRLLCFLLLLFFLEGCAAFTQAGANPDRDADPRAWFENKKLHKLLDKTTRSHETANNSVRLLVNGKEAFARRYENISSAKFILVKTYLFTDDEEGRRMASALSDRARAGIPVVMQYDVKGSVESADDIADMLAFVEPALPVGEKKIIHDMRDAGVYIIPTNSPGRPLELQEWWNNTQRLFKQPAAAIKRSFESLVLFEYRDHEKYFITGHDGGEIRAIVGGMNIASEYALGGIENVKDKETGRAGWHDVDAEVSGPVAYAVLNEYLKDVRRTTGDELSEVVRSVIRKTTVNPNKKIGNARIRFVSNHPLHERKRYIEELYRLLIQATPSGEPIFIGTPYFAPSKRIRDVMLSHAKRGGKITVLTNSFESNNHPVLTEAAHYSVLELMKKTENFKLYEWKPNILGGEQTMHQKVASFGHFGPVIIGSFNMDAQSAVHNTEGVLLINDSVLRGQFDQMIERDLSPEHAKRIFREDIETAPILMKIRSFLIHNLAWYWL